MDKFLFFIYQFTLSEYILPTVHMLIHAHVWSMIILSMHGGGGGGIAGL